MNNIFLYQHENGRQFLSTADHVVMYVFCNFTNRKMPKPIGIWKFKTVKNGNKNN